MTQSASTIQLDLRVLAPREREVARMRIAQINECHI